MGAHLRFLVYEQASATGFFENPVTSSILSEGFGMLRTLTADLQAAGHSVTTILDRRFAALQTLLETERVVIVSSSGSAKEALLDIAPSVDATYVIAPESRGILKNLMLDLERIHASSINSRASAIETVSNKTELYEHLCKSGLIVPKSRTLSLHSNIDDIIRVVSSEVGFPAVFKPETNAGCTGLSLVQSKEEVEGAVAKISAESRDRFLVQEMVSGVPASVSVFSTGSEASAASLNEQDVLLESPNSASGYKGGTIPLQSPLRQ
jgi:predicted ATP-grasp superfamily ATP-dependent carboligase